MHSAHPRHPRRHRSHPLLLSLLSFPSTPTTPRSMHHNNTPAYLPIPHHPQPRARMLPLPHLPNPSVHVGAQCLSRFGAAELAPHHRIQPLAVSSLPASRPSQATT
ncbi:hypothetical protein BD410DRAFT_789395 [Rickenella mellea]|uniref:Uncharacterized protein n=1 Tax=Rickenella mellea TaxID=50990 RepID=A0A4Y7Q3C9_9AGAM|nr:hypothetical protein BD410DRAFT_789395 [Rickenella mellea]